MKEITYKEIEKVDDFLSYMRDMETALMTLLGGGTPINYIVLDEVAYSVVLDRVKTINPYINEVGTDTNTKFFDFGSLKISTMLKNKE